MSVISIISNPAVNTTQSSLRTMNDNIATSTERLASGQRVFNASEDTAALALAAGFQVESAAMEEAILNASTSVSQLQVTEGAASTVNDILTRMKALASQAASGQLSDTNRQLIDTEFQLLKTEIGRITSDTEFDGIKLLNGSSTFTNTFGSSLPADGVAGISFDDQVVLDDSSFRLSYDNTSETMTLEKIDGATTESESVNLTAILDNMAGTGNNLGAGQSFEVNFADFGVKVRLDNTFDRAASIQDTVTDATGPDIGITNPTFDTSNADTNLTPTAIENLVNIPTGYNATTGNLSIPTNTDGAVVNFGGLTGIQYSVNGGPLLGDGADTGDLVGGAGFVDVYADNSGAPVLLGRVNYASMTTTGTTDGFLNVSVGQGLVGTTVTPSTGDLNMEFMIGTGAVLDEDIAQVRIPPLTLSALGIEFNDVTSVLNAESSIDNIDGALDTVSSLMATLGGQISRMEFSADRLRSALEDLGVAKANLLETDVSKEITELTSSQAMMEMSLEMLNRLNQQPQRLLRLLEG